MTKKVPPPKQKGYAICSGCFSVNTFSSIKYYCKNPPFQVPCYCSLCQVDKKHFMVLETAYQKLFFESQSPYGNLSIREQQIVNIISDFKSQHHFYEQEIESGITSVQKPTKIKYVRSKGYGARKKGN